MLVPPMLSRFFTTDLAVDIGTSNTRIFARGRGVVLDEPSVVAIRDEAVLATGQAAKAMLGREPASVRVTRPLVHGVIAEPDFAQRMLASFFARVQSTWRAKMAPRVLLTVPSDSTPVERRAVRDLAASAGAGEIVLVPAPFAAALGAGMPIHQAGAHMVVIVGGGTTEVALLSLSGIVYSESLRAGGDDMDEAIMQWVRKQESLLIGTRQAEAVKLTLGSATGTGSGRTTAIKGRAVIDGLPKTVYMTDDDVAHALRDSVVAIVEAVRACLERTPPELAGDIVETGIVLAGGGALLPGLADVIREQTGLPVAVAPEPLHCAVRGVGEMLESVKLLQRVATDAKGHPRRSDHR
jgi:rod shape-determining protein MreB